MLVLVIVIIAGILSAILWSIVASVRMGRNATSILEKLFGWLGATFFAGTIFLPSIIIGGGITEIALFVAIYAFASLQFLFAVFRRMRRKSTLAVNIALICIFFTAFTIQFRWIAADNAVPTLSESTFDFMFQYTPESGKLARLNEPATLSIDENCPKLDGATALYPIYAAYANEVYPAEALNWPDEYDPDKDGDQIALDCTKTANAYRNLVNGEADVIFVAAPSEEQLQYASDRGEEMIFTPIGREAFVFFVNSENPVSDLTADQIRSIYSGEASDWNAFGSDLGKIIAFQRNEGSGSQSALIRFMDDVPLMEARTEITSGNMGGIIESVSDYKNYRNAIGFSFRFYSTEMVRNSQIKLLSISGVAPTKENILNDTYPISSEFYAVHLASNNNPNIQSLIDWILSEQGQSLIDQTGYVTLR